VGESELNATLSGSIEVNDRWRRAMGDILHKTTIAAPTTAVYVALTEQHHPKSSPHSVFTG
jgi:hypothetical protein